METDRDRRDGVAYRRPVLDSNLVECPRERLPWKSAFWVWTGDAPAAAADVKPDLLYVQVVGTRWPDGISEASHYVMVRRIEDAAQVTPQMARALADVYRDVLETGPASIIGPFGRLSEIQAADRRLSSWLLRNEMPAAQR